MANSANYAYIPPMQAHAYMLPPGIARRTQGADSEIDPSFEPPDLPGSDGNMPGSAQPVRPLDIRQGTGRST